MHRRSRASLATSTSRRRRSACASVTTTLGWRHAYGDVVPSVLLAFQGGAQSFSASGVPIDRDAFVAEAGVNYAVSSMFSVGLTYSGQFGQRATDNAFKGRVDLRF